MRSVQAKGRRDEASPSSLEELQSLISKQQVYMFHCLRLSCFII